MCGFGVCWAESVDLVVAESHVIDGCELAVDRAKAKVTKGGDRERM